MNLTDTHIMKFLKKGSPIIIGEDVCALYCATLGEIVDIGYDTFLSYLQIMNIQKPVLEKKKHEEIEDFLDSLSDFQYLLFLTKVQPEMNEQVKMAFNFFTHENVFFSFETSEITIGPIEEKHIIREEEFNDIQQCIRRMYWLDDEHADEAVLNKNDSAKVRAMKLQMQKNRAKLAKAKAKSSRGKSSLEFSDLIASVAAGNCGLNITNIWDVTYYAFHDQLKRMGWRERFDINNRAAMAGAKMKPKDLEYWIKSIKSDDK